METSTGRALAVALAPAVLILTACSAGLSNAEVEACNMVSGWSAGKDPDDFARSVATAESALGDVDGSLLTDPLTWLAASTEGEQAANADWFVAVCKASGWDPPEG